VGFTFLECGGSSPLTFVRFWSAAVHRRLLSLLPVFVSDSRKTAEKKAAMNRRTPKR
jgi:hypothetical protein